MMICGIDDSPVWRGLGIAKVVKEGFLKGEDIPVFGAAELRMYCWAIWDLQTFCCQMWSVGGSRGSSVHWGGRGLDMS